jgi:hypothetical protein
LPLALEREANDLSLLNGAASGFIGRGYDKVGDGAPLDFRGAFQDTGACRTKARKERAAALW